MAYIENTWKVIYSVSGLNKWLHQNGFSYKQPKGVPHKFDEQKQAVLIEEYKKLRDSVSDDEPILFMDAVHPTQATSGWIRKGVDKPIETTGSRTRMNIVWGSAVKTFSWSDDAWLRYREWWHYQGLSETG